jgi:hypothetical protein
LNHAPGDANGADTGGRHQAPAHLIIPDNGQQTAMLVSLTETSSPAKWSMLRFSF